MIFSYLLHKPDISRLLIQTAHSHSQAHTHTHIIMQPALLCLSSLVYSMHIRATPPVSNQITATFTSLYNKVLYITSAVEFIYFFCMRLTMLYMHTRLTSHKKYVSTQKSTKYTMLLRLYVVPKL